MTTAASPQPAGMVLALVVSLPFPIALNAAPASEIGLRQATEQLRRVWQQDPLTARRPFPAIRVVDAVSASDCPAATFPASGPLVLVCPDSGAVLVRRDKFSALHGVFGDAAALFVVAYGLGQSLIYAMPPGAQAPSVPAATPGLRAACAAGTLLAAVPLPDAERRLLLNNAISAGEQGFAASAAAQLGTGPQRAYALLSGMGGTPLTCEIAAMARLARGAEPLEAFLATRGTGVGIDKFCRQPPACPRGVSFGLAGI